jgi:hypothetical protein
MAQYEHLPIYRNDIKLAVHLEITVRGFSRSLSEPRFIGLLDLQDLNT